MSITKTDKGWHVDLRPQGKYGKRLRRTFVTQGEARAFVNYQHAEASKTKDWIQEVTTDNRRLSQLAELWLVLHGATLKDGELRYSKLKHLIKFYGDPVARHFTSEDYLRGRTKRMAEGATANTANHDLTYLKAVFNKLISLGQYQYPNPLKNIQKLKFDEKEVSYLELSQITALLDACQHDEDLTLITEVGLSTGCRWGEVEPLRVKQVRASRIVFSKTKTTNARTVPIAKELEARLLSNITPAGRVFRHVDDKKFQRALIKAGIELPKGQRTHVLRHTFAVHFMLNRGNILDLQKILGHKTLQMTLRYAGYHPDYLQDALTKNPLFTISQQHLEVQNG
jgi:integrase